LAFSFRASGSYVCLIVLVALSVTAGGCGDPGEDAKEVASSCKNQSCPAGTAQTNKASVQGSSDISGGYDPATYKAEGAYKRMGSGSCEYICQVFSPCPDSTFPVITQTCFTCGLILPDGTIGQGMCQGQD
jgi:hypothetical protein